MFVFSVKHSRYLITVRLVVWPWTGRPDSHWPRAPMRALFGSTNFPNCEVRVTMVNPNWSYTFRTTKRAPSRQRYVSVVLEQIAITLRSLERLEFWLERRKHISDINQHQQSRVGKILSKVLRPLFAYCSYAYAYKMLFIFHIFWSSFFDSCSHFSFFENFSNRFFFLFLFSSSLFLGARMPSSTKFALLYACVFNG